MERVRTVVVTGSASGIGQATVARFASTGARVIGVDLRDAQVIADLATAQGRRTMCLEVERLAPQGVDTVVAVAGLASGDVRSVVAVNYFGAVATLQGLRPLLAKTPRPCAVAVVSTAALPELMAMDAELVDACLAGDEATALAAAEGKGNAVYPSSKHALARWLRQAAVSAEWAGAGILLNAVAPGTVRTAMTAPFLATEEGRAFLQVATPIAVNDYGQPEEIAEVLAFLGSLQGRYLLGQIVCVDGGTEALARPALV